MSFLSGRPSTDESAPLWTELRGDLASCGYFPELVEDTVNLGVGDEPLIEFVVHHEPTFNLDEIRRHLTVLALTPTRLVISHTDEQPADGERGGTGQGASSCESIGLAGINTVALTRVVSSPENYRRGDPAQEAWLSVSWGAMRRIDWEPATCADPDCEADHGVTGAITPDDLTVRMSATADGAERVERLVRFGTLLQQYTGRGTTRSLGKR
ncbi:DUF5998 family protein [Granulicoccus phenolivorans]|uniref:DUF5998 family protein n=1 Tax=Granulicoccus phenolivorans TaxID=266854 RepID=UPI0004237120|nr:DUF5998 family protein [Granulicoccus phenolivorans]